MRKEKITVMTVIICSFEGMNLKLEGLIVPIFVMSLVCFNHKFICGTRSRGDSHPAPSLRNPCPPFTIRPKQNINVGSHTHLITATL